MSTTAFPIVPEAILSALADSLQRELQALLAQHVTQARALHTGCPRMDESTIRGCELGLTGSLAAIGTKLEELRRLQDAATWVTANAPHDADDAA